MEPKNKSIRFSMRFNLTIEHHQEAWEKLSKIPKGERNEYCVMSLLDNTTVHPLGNMVKTVIKEEMQQAVEDIKNSTKTMLQEVTIDSQTSTKRMQEQNKENENKSTDEIPSVALDFIAGL